MKDDMKENNIEQRFRAYFAGVETPAVDLTKAKRAVTVGRSRKRGWIAALSSVAACLVAVVAIITLLVWPSSGGKNEYRIVDVLQTTSSYTELCEQYPTAVCPFANFSIASNAQAQYTVYTAEEMGDVLLRADVAYVSAKLRLNATLWLDLTDGEFIPEELASYSELPPKNNYRYERKYENGEYVFRAYFLLKEKRCYADVTSNSSDALEFLVSTLLV